MAENILLFTFSAMEKESDESEGICEGLSGTMINGRLSQYFAQNGIDLPSGDFKAITILKIEDGIMESESTERADEAGNAVGYEHRIYSIRWRILDHRTTDANNYTNKPKTYIILAEPPRPIEFQSSDAKPLLSDVVGEIDGLAQEVWTFRVYVNAENVKLVDGVKVELDEPVDVSVSMKRTVKEPTDDQALWDVIKNTTEAISFDKYSVFVDDIVFGAEKWDGEKVQGKKHLMPFPRVDEYHLLKAATDVFLMTNAGVEIEQGDDDRWNNYLTELNGTEKFTLPYLALIWSRLTGGPIENEAAQKYQSYIQEKLTRPTLIELIWSYWHEEGMLVQAMNAISLRFQNIRNTTLRDPIARLDIAPLVPMSNLLWGYIQDEQHRLTLQRRAYEYDHHYGLKLYGKAIPAMRAIDSRSNFLEAFHTLLNICSVFYKEDDDTTVVPDAFPVLNALKEVQMLLARGMHNQYGDLPWTARTEMLMQQWLLARPEMHKFLGGPAMIPYLEDWMDRVDTVKKMQGWSDVSVTHFHYLARFGEQILLSIRFGNWLNINDRAQAANWAVDWRSEIQGYIHNYRAVTGVDLTGERVDYTMPSVLLRKRLVAQKQ